MKVMTITTLLVGVTTTLAQLLTFDNFPLNLSLSIGESYTLNWGGGFEYVNISLFKWSYFNGAALLVTNLTTFNSDFSVVWILDASLQQGVYDLVISSPDYNPNESAYFSTLAAVQSHNSSATSAACSSPSSSPTHSSQPSPSSLSSAVKVGIGLGIPLAVAILSVFGLLFRRERIKRLAAEAAISRQHYPLTEDRIPSSTQQRPKVLTPELQAVDIRHELQEHEK